MTTLRPSSLDKSALKSGVVSLFPPGSAFNTEEGSNFRKLAEVLVELPIGRYIDFLDNVCNAINPSTVDTDVIQHWEQICFNNDSCYNTTGLTLSQRRKAVIDRLTGADSFHPTITNVQSNLRTLLADNTVDVEENNIFRIGKSTIGDTLNDIIIVSINGVGSDPRYNRTVDENIEFVQCWLESILPSYVAWNIEGRAENIPAALLDWIRFSTRQLFTDYNLS